MVLSQFIPFHIPSPYCPKVYIKLIYLLGIIRNFPAKLLCVFLTSSSELQMYPVLAIFIRTNETSLQLPIAECDTF